MVHRAAGRLLRVDAVLSGHLLDLRRCPREERPASQVRPMGLGIALEHLRRIPLRIHSDGDKHLGPEIRAEACLQPGQLRGQQWTGVRAGGEDEGHCHDLAAQVLEGEPCALLRRQVERCAGPIFGRLRSCPRPG